MTINQLSGLIAQCEVELRGRESDAII
jgi:hypothetical protein